MPAHLFFHPGHTWARVENDDTVTVGIDAFAEHLVGSSAAFALPAIGQAVRQGEPALGLSLDGRRVELVCPVDGTIVAVNSLAHQEPAAVHASPYQAGWLLKIRSPRLAGDLRSLLAGDLARRSMDAACETLSAQASSPQLGQVLADGGTPADGIAVAVSGEHWDVLARSFFLTEQEALHA
jgi:glycine cleavage system H lipoate-binding protein